MTVEALGESALILRHLPLPANKAAARIRASFPELEEVIAAFDTVGIYFKDVPPDPSVLEAALSHPLQDETPKRHLVPVCYEMGEDTTEAAEMLGIDPGDIATAHAGPVYTCFAIGFCPGFPYLGPLPATLRGLPRRPSPRIRVEPGSVAITGDQTGIYPLTRPGGWWLIGKTPLTTVDVDDRYFPIKAGDEVVFEAISPSLFKDLKGHRL
jgi:inhibitor of KinA